MVHTPVSTSNAQTSSFPSPPKITNVAPEGSGATAPAPLRGDGDGDSSATETSRHVPSARAKTQTSFVWPRDVSYPPKTTRSPRNTTAQCPTRGDGAAFAAAAASEVGSALVATAAAPACRRVQFAPATRNSHTSFRVPRIPRPPKTTAVSSSTRV